MFCGCFTDAGEMQKSGTFMLYVDPCTWCEEQLQGFSADVSMYYRDLKEPGHVNTAILDEV